MDCDTGHPRLVRDWVKKAFSSVFTMPLSNEEVTFGDIQSIVNDYIYDHGLDALETGACAAITEGAAGEFCENGSFKEAMKFLNDEIINPYARTVVIDTMEYAEDAVAEFALNVADAAANEVRQIGKKNIFQRAAGDEKCETESETTSCWFYVWC
eukprot:224566_1